ncbi:hypothetical protein BHM03_00053575, partial [Ensete ventricosum]
AADGGDSSNDRGGSKVRLERWQRRKQKWVAAARATTGEDGSSVGCCSGSLMELRKKKQGSKKEAVEMQLSAGSEVRNVRKMVIGQRGNEMATTGGRRGLWLQFASLSDGGGGLGRDGMSAAAREAEGATSGKLWPTVGGSGEGGGRVAAGNGCDSGSCKGGRGRQQHEEEDGRRGVAAREAGATAVDAGVAAVVW